MPSYNLKFNADDSVIRHILVGLLADLNRKIFYFNQVDNETRKKIEIPFFYSIAGDESLMYDHFLFDTLKDPDGKIAEANYESVPRGVLNLTSFSIDSSSLVNKYIRGTYSKLEEDNEMRSYIAQFQMIPVIFNYDATIVLDSTLDVFKVTEKLVKQLYKNNQYNVDVGTLQDGTYKIASYYRMPEDYTQERPVQFTFNDKKEYRIIFNIEVLSFIPAFEFEDEQFAGNRMFTIENTTRTSLDVDKEPDSIDDNEDNLFNKTRS